MTNNTKTLSLEPLLSAAQEALKLPLEAIRVEDMVEALGVSLSSYHRYKKAGRIPWIKADEAAIRLGLHPLLVWQDEWLDLDREWLQTH